MNTDWKLIDGHERNLENEAQFKMPPRELRQGVKEGQLVKIGIECPIERGELNGERFWVEVVLAHGQGGERRYTGTVRNWLMMTNRHDVTYGTKIQFGPENILDLETPW